MNGSLRAKISVLLILSLFLVISIKATENVNDSINNSTNVVDHGHQIEHNNTNLTTGNTNSTEIHVDTHSNSNLTNINTENNTVNVNQTDSFAKEINTNTNNITESDKNIISSIDNSTNVNTSQSSMNTTQENITKIDENKNSRVESDNLQVKENVTTKIDDASSTTSAGNQNKTDEIEKVTNPSDNVENTKILESVNVETDTKDSKTNSPNDSNNQKEIPASQDNTNPNQQPQEKEGIYRYENFNLTNEIERLYNSSNYEETEEEKLFRDAEKVHNDMKVEEETEEVRLRKEWEQEVSNFDATDILTVKLKKRQSFNFYSDVTEVPSLYKIAYYVSNENLPIDFFIYDQKDKLIHKTKNRGQIYKELLLEKPGTYKFVLDNSRFSDWKRVSFAVHTGNNTDTSIKTDQFDHFTTKINNVDNKLEEFKLREKLVIKKLEGHYESTKSHNDQIAKYSIIEMITMILILLIQLFYLKHLMSKVA